MKHFRMIGEAIGIRHPVENFEDVTDKGFPYYQLDGHYAVCEFCESAVQIVGGASNSVQTGHRRMYAAHCRKEIQGLPFCDHRRCVGYKGNANNWQRIYKQQSAVETNKNLQAYIDSHGREIATELYHLTGIRFTNQSGVNKLFRDVYGSFIAHGGLYVSEWYPVAVPYMMMNKTAPVKFFGYVMSDELKQKLRRYGIVLNDHNQFKENGYEVTFTMDNDENPRYINVRLVTAKTRIELLSCPATWLSRDDMG
ncbi:MAG: hypothetical protein LKI78_02260 [Bifidobacterium tibiigranuli]|nr:hypothetical protein [Bifidobacterium tibiigranuli]